MDRREFIKKSSLALAFTMVPFKKLSKLNNIQTTQENFVNIFNNIGYYTNKGGTIAWCISPKSCIVVDAQYPDTVEDFISHMRYVFKKKVDLVINTHHHYDHTMGNYIIREHSTKIVANKNCVELQKKQNEIEKEDQHLCVADTVYDKEYVQKTDETLVRCFHQGPAHTGGDTIVHMEDVNYGVLGDLVFKNIYPYIDLKGGGSIEGWIKTLDFVTGYFDKDTFFCFGHADVPKNVVGIYADVIKQKDYLNALLEYVQKEIKKGRKLNKIIASTTEIPKFEYLKQQWPDALKANLEQAYKELTMKK